MFYTGVFEVMDLRDDISKSFRSKNSIKLVYGRLIFYCQNFDRTLLSPPKKLPGQRESQTLQNDLCLQTYNLLSGRSATIEL